MTPSPGGTSMTDPCAWGVVEAARMIRAGQISARDYARALLARIDARDAGLQAWARIDRHGLEAQAARCDAEAARGTWRGLLHGVPIGIKDNLATAGLETTAGSAMLAGQVPDEDAYAVRRLRQAGALVLGKTAMTEFAAMDPAPTRNPWNANHTPGGSSSGSAAAVAARMVPAALGTQTAGSVLRPAAYCGVAGLKPTYEAVSRRGLVACAWSMDHVGIMAREVDDVATLLGVLAGPPHTSAPDGAPVIGIPDRYFFDNLDADVSAAFDAAVATFERAGARVAQVRLPQQFDAMVDAGIVTMYAEMAACHADRFTARAAEFPPRLRILIEAGRTIAAADYVNAQRIRRLETAALSRLLETITVLLTPATTTPAPQGLDSTGDWRLNLPFSVSGHPAIALACGRSRGGLPIGLQMAAAHGAEARLLAAGRLFQTHTDWHRQYPPTALPEPA
jgi:aspartyl-tRNA(Asn)/glutamyl-tRNA(Gln) amidotransferase subunit A